MLNILLSARYALTIGRFHPQPLRSSDAQTWSSFDGADLPRKSAVQSPYNERTAADITVKECHAGWYLCNVIYKAK